jgi:hypothetical protein
MYSSNTLDSKALAELQIVFKKCLLALEGAYGRDSSQITAKRPVVAARLVRLAQQGVMNPTQLEQQALAGLVREYLH